MRPAFFKTTGELRRWLRSNHASATELWVGFYKIASGKGGVTYKQALDEALCFGWIDGVRKSLDAESYVQRFSPRTKRSYWSAVNTKRMQELRAEGRVHAAGLAAFERRDSAATERYSFERDTAAFGPELEKRFKANRKAWAYFEAEAPWYRRLTAHWVTSARRDRTREQRLRTLIDESAEGRRIPGLPQRKRPLQPRPRATTSSAPPS